MRIDGDMLGALMADPVPAAQQCLPLPELSELEDAFAREYIATGGNGTQAYLRTRPQVKPTSAAVEASKLLRKPKISERIADLRRELNTREVMSLAERRAILSAIGRADQLDFWEPSPYGGMRLKPLDELSPEQRLAIQELIEESGKDGKRTNVKLYSSVYAIDMLNKMDGVYKQTVQLDGEVRHEIAVPPKQLTLEEWTAWHKDYWADQLAKLSPARKLPPSAARGETGESP